jgi:hypothetical protein
MFSDGNDELDNILKAVDVTYFKAIREHSCAGIEENHRTGS